MRHSAKGFTLIELLVVIAIIAILAAILFPVFARVKLQAKMTSALSNVRQVIMASIQYSTDNDDKTPLYMDVYPFSWPPLGTYNGWPRFFYPYLRSHEIVYDPVLGPPTAQLQARPSAVDSDLWWSLFPEIHMQFNDYPTISLEYDPSGNWAGDRTMTGMEWISYRMAYATDEPRTVAEADTSTNPYWQNGDTFERTALCPSYSEASMGQYTTYPPDLDSNSIYMDSMTHNYMVIAGIGDGHAKALQVRGITYNADTDPPSGGSIGGCVYAHMDRFCPPTICPGNDPNATPSDHELDLLKLWGKAWDRSW